MRTAILVVGLTTQLACGGAMAKEAATAMASEPSSGGATASPPGQAGPPPASEAPGDGASSVTTTAARDGAHDKSLLVYSARLNMAVFQVEPGLDAVQQVAERMGGYLATRSDVQVDVRVPRDKFHEALREIEKTGDVIHRNISAEDVTDRFTDVESRLRNARAIRDRLQALLERAPVKEALEIERELGRVTQDIEVLEGKIKLLRDQIAFSSITVQYTAKEQSLEKTTFSLPFGWLKHLGLKPLLGVWEQKGGAE